MRTRVLSLGDPNVTSGFFSQTQEWMRTQGLTSVPSGQDRPIVFPICVGYKSTAVIAGSRAVLSVVHAGPETVDVDSGLPSTRFQARWLGHIAVGLHSHEPIQEIARRAAVRVPTFDDCRVAWGWYSADLPYVLASRWAAALDAGTAGGGRATDRTAALSGILPSIADQVAAAVRQ